MDTHFHPGLLLAAALWLAPGAARGQEQAAPPAPAAEPATEPAPAEGTSLDSTLEAGESEFQEPKRRLVKFNEYEGPYIGIRVGGGFLFEGAAYSQDAASRGQFPLAADTKVRDARVMLKVRFPKLKRLTFSTGIMYDGVTDEWLFRETGFMIAVPELWGHLFIGRTKEGFSLNKVMVGYAGWTMERATISDATIPILADGIKWLGYLPKRGFLWNLGVYTDLVSKGQSFSTYQNQAVARLMWLPIASEKKGTLLHLGVSLRYGKPLDNTLRLRSRPEANPAPYFVDTENFTSPNTRMVGVEAYYRPGRWLFGTEYFVQKASSHPNGNPLFHGGDVVVSWLVTGETRSYNTRGGFFNAVSPNKTVFEGGPGAWEAVARFSYIDLDDQGIHGGKFWRVTPMLNWHMSDNVRLEFAYGYGILDRFSAKGETLFFQSRLQLSL
ncbi:porin [Aggregicoccus sp. 17bor-14]|uniref:OprO/OprP family phosphate-selective porin n=1 Tax=Myxococcaceae TaxID=31 RepID=UPI00129CF55A|nr:MULTISPECIES: porin [Myxococcaceae]MBF5043107.1 porin [Simulacricoccus sp. 17bor-14]MRI88869.1 porin [Aggregicoccus sp. 17bor-14]